MITKIGCSPDPPPFTMPVGAMMPYGGTTAPSGWLLCDGSAVSRDTYSELFAVVSTTFGIGDGTTTFNLPPSGYFFFNKASAGTGSTLGGTFGSIDHTHTVDPPSTNTSTDGAHTHTVDPGSVNTSSDGSHTHTGTTSGPSSTSPTQLVLGAVASSTHTHTFTTDAAGTHNHTVDIPSTTSSSNGDHNHSVDVPSFNSGTSNPPGCAVNFIIKT